MTNKDKYLKDNVSVEELARKLVDHFELDMELTDSENSVLYYNCQNFFIEQTKPTLTEDERDILKNIEKKYKYIGRSSKEDKLIYLYVNIEDGWKPHVLEEYNHLFQFIKERRRI